MRHRRNQNIEISEDEMDSESMSSDSSRSSLVWDQSIVLNNDLNKCKSNNARSGVMPV